MTRPTAFLGILVLLALANAGNVLAQGIGASPAGLYAGLPGLGGHLVTRGGLARLPSRPGTSAAVRFTTTAEHRAAGARAAGFREHAASRAWVRSRDSAVRVDAPSAPGEPVVLTETHDEGRVHVVPVHPEDPESAPVAPRAPSSSAGRASGAWRMQWLVATGSPRLGA